MTATNILVPVDFSPPSLAAMEYAAAIARSSSGRLTLLHVYEPSLAESPIIPAATPADFFESRRHSELRRLEALWQSSRALDALQVELRVEVGLASSVVVEWARSNSVDLIVMGTKGRTGLARMLLGNVAETVLHHAPCAVLSVHLPALPAGS